MARRQFVPGAMLWLEQLSVVIAAGGWLASVIWPMLSEARPPLRITALVVALLSTYWTIDADASWPSRKSCPVIPVKSTSTTCWLRRGESTTLKTGLWAPRLGGLTMTVTVHEAPATIEPVQPDALIPGLERNP